MEEIGEYRILIVRGTMGTGVYLDPLVQAMLEEIITGMAAYPILTALVITESGECLYTEMDV